MCFRFLPLWVGARGVEFDWKYVQMSFDSNISLVITAFHFVTETCESMTASLVKHVS